MKLIGSLLFIVMFFVGTVSSLLLIAIRGGYCAGEQFADLIVSRMVKKAKRDIIQS